MSVNDIYIYKYIYFYSVVSIDYYIIYIYTSSHKPYVVYIVLDLVIFRAHIGGMEYSGRD